MAFNKKQTNFFTQFVCEAAASAPYSSEYCPAGSRFTVPQYQPGRCQANMNAPLTQKRTSVTVGKNLVPGLRHELAADDRHMPRPGGKIEHAVLPSSLRQHRVYAKLATSQRHVGAGPVKDAVGFFVCGGGGRGHSDRCLSDCALLRSTVQANGKA